MGEWAKLWDKKKVDGNYRKLGRVCKGFFIFSVVVLLAITVYTSFIAGIHESMEEAIWSFVVVFGLGLFGCVIMIVMFYFIAVMFMVGAEAAEGKFENKDKKEKND